MKNKLGYLNIEAIRIIVSKLNNLKVVENPENIFKIHLDSNIGLIVDWQNRQAEVMIKNLAMELNLDYKNDFMLGCNKFKNLPEKINQKEKVIEEFKNILEDYISIAELFTI